jgi:hypothetical protein
MACSSGAVVAAVRECFGYLVLERLAELRPLDARADLARLQA